MNTELAILNKYRNPIRVIVFHCREKSAVLVNPKHIHPEGIDSIFDYGHVSQRKPKASSFFRLDALSSQDGLGSVI